MKVLTNEQFTLILELIALAKDLNDNEFSYVRQNVPVELTKAFKQKAFTLNRILDSLGKSFRMDVIHADFKPEIIGDAEDVHRPLH